MKSLKESIFLFFTNVYFYLMIFRGRNGYHNPVKDMTVEYVTSGGYYSHTHAPVYQSTTVPL